MRQSGLLRIFSDAHALESYERLDSYNVHDWPPRDWLKRQPIQVPEIHLREPVTTCKEAKDVMKLNTSTET